MELRNLPEDGPRFLNDLIVCHDGQVSSMSLVRGGLDLGVSMTLFAFAEGESVSEERYETDTLYLCIEGSMAIKRQDAKPYELQQGQVIKVSAGVEHAVESVGVPFKMLQINV